MMNKKVAAVFLSILGIGGLFWYPAIAHAANVTVTDFCNVQVVFKATVPDSVRQGESFTITNITVQPKNTFGFTVSSSVFDMTATNTSSPTYKQNFIATNPSPTTGHNTYTGIYPNWSHSATGPVGSNITIKLVRTVTVVQGYGTVNCPFSKTLATIPITAPLPSDPDPSPTPSPSNSPNPSPSNTPPVTIGGNNSSSSSSGSGISKDQNSSNQNKNNDKTSKGGGEKKGNATKGEDSDSSSNVEDRSTGNLPDLSTVSVVPLIIEVRDDSGKPIQGAEVTLDGSQLAKTDRQGRVVFSNILTGGHNISVFHKGQKISKDIELTTADVGKVIPMKMPATPIALHPAVLATGAILIAGMSGFGIFLTIRRKKQQAVDQALELPSQHLTYLPGVVAGSVVETSSGYTMLSGSQERSLASTYPLSQAQSQPQASTEQIPSPSSSTFSTAASVSPLLEQPGVPPPMKQPLVSSQTQAQPNPQPKQYVATTITAVSSQPSMVTQQQAQNVQPQTQPQAMPASPTSQAVSQQVAVMPQIQKVRAAIGQTPVQPQRYAHTPPTPLPSTNRVPVSTPSQSAAPQPAPTVATGPDLTIRHFAKPTQITS